MTLQRYIANDLVLRNYKIPAKVGLRGSASQMEGRREEASVPGRLLVMGAPIGAFLPDAGAHWWGTQMQQSQFV